MNNTLNNNCLWCLPSYDWNGAFGSKKNIAFIEDAKKVSQVMTFILQTDDPEKEIQEKILQEESRGLFFTHIIISGHGSFDTKSIRVTKDRVLVAADLLFLTSFPRIQQVFFDACFGGLVAEEFTSKTAIPSLGPILSAKASLAWVGLISGKLTMQYFHAEKGNKKEEPIYTTLVNITASYPANNHLSLQEMDQTAFKRDTKLAFFLGLTSCIEGDHISATKSLQLALENPACREEAAYSLAWIKVDKTKGQMSRIKAHSNYEAALILYPYEAESSLLCFENAYFHSKNILFPKARFLFSGFLKNQKTKEKTFSLLHTLLEKGDKNNQALSRYMLGSYFTQSQEFSHIQLGLQMLQKSAAIGYRPAVEKMEDWGGFVCTKQCSTIKGRIVSLWRSFLLPQDGTTAFCHSIISTYKLTG